MKLYYVWVDCEQDVLREAQAGITEVEDELDRLGPPGRDVDTLQNQQDDLQVGSSIHVYG